MKYVLYLWLVMVGAVISASAQDEEAQPQSVSWQEQCLQMLCEAEAEDITTEVRANLDKKVIGILFAKVKERMDGDERAKNEAGQAQMALMVMNGGKVMKKLPQKWEVEELYVRAAYMIKYGELKDVYADEEDRKALYQLIQDGKWREYLKSASSKGSIGAKMLQCYTLWEARHKQEARWKFIKKLAKQGNARAMSILGNSMLYGMIHEEMGNMADKEKWMEKMRTYNISLEDRKIILNYGGRKCQPGTKEWDEMIKWLARSVELGEADIDSIRAMIDLLENVKEEEVEVLNKKERKRLAEAGQKAKQSQQRATAAYRQGMSQMEKKDQRKAVAFFRQAAKDQSLEAKKMLVKLYIGGEPDVQNRLEARKLLEALYERDLPILSRRYYAMLFLLRD